MSEALEGLTFEEAFGELEATVQRLEAGNLTLDEAITLYQRGMQLAQRCSVALDAAELQVEELSEADPAAVQGED
jgi:exodeoxyribonuclease VII small subunit